MNLLPYSQDASRVLLTNGTGSLVLGSDDSKERPVVQAISPSSTSVGSAACACDASTKKISEVDDVTNKADRMFRIQQVDILKRLNVPIRFPEPVFELISEYIVPDTIIDCLILHAFGYRKAHEKEIPGIVNRLCNGEMRNFLIELAKYDLRQPEEKELVVKILNQLFLPYVLLTDPQVSSKDQAFIDDLKKLKELPPDLLKELIQRVSPDIQEDYREVVCQQDIRKILRDRLFAEAQIFSNSNPPNDKSPLSQLALFIQILVFEVHNFPTDKILLPSVELPLNLACELIHASQLRQFQCLINQELTVNQLKELLVEMLPINNACIRFSTCCISVLHHDNCVFVKLVGFSQQNFNEEIWEFLSKNAEQFPNVHFMALGDIVNGPFIRTKGITEPNRAFIMYPTQKQMSKLNDGKADEMKAFMQPLSPGVYQSASGNVKIENPDEIPIPLAVRPQRPQAIVVNRPNRALMLGCAAIMVVATVAFFYRVFYPKS